MSMLHQTIGQEELVSDLTGFNKILTPDQKWDEEIDEGDFYWQETPEVDGVLHQEYA